MVIAAIVKTILQNNYKTIVKKDKNTQNLSKK